MLTQTSEVPEHDEELSAVSIARETQRIRRTIQLIPHEFEEDRKILSQRGQQLKAVFLESMKVKGYDAELIDLMEQNLDVYAEMLLRIQELSPQQARTARGVLEPLVRKGQMSSEDWSNPVLRFGGCEAILCELNPDFDLTTIGTQGDYLAAATLAIGNAIHEKHPKADKMREALRKGSEAGENDVLSESLGACDKVLGATKKWRLSMVDKASLQTKIYQTEGRDYKLRELMAFAKGLRPSRSSASKSPEELLFANDNIHGATLRGLALASEWHESDEYHRGITQNFKGQNLKITLSLPNGEKAQSLWGILSKGGPAMVKAHYALWARYFVEVEDGLAVKQITVDINQFCSDLGYSKAKNGGYKARDKQQAMRFLEVLTTVEMSATFQDKKDKKLRRLRGPIWARGMIAEEADNYDDLFGAAREGSPELWTPRSFSYAPGPWHADEDWRRYNHYVGKVGAGLMRLDNRTDEWAILIGGYLGTLARTNSYVPKRLKIGTILKAVGLAQSKNAKREIAKYREKLFAALDKLKEIDVIAAWELDKVNINDPAESDTDDAAAWSDYAQEEIYPPGDWRTWIVSITFPQENDRVRLAAQKSKAIAAKKRRRAPAKEDAQEE